MEINDRPSTIPPSYSPDKGELESWQYRMLPLMQKMVIGLTIFFFLASLFQLIYLHSSILSTNDVAMSPASFQHHKENYSFSERKEAVLLETLIALEIRAFERRHHKANILLMASIWIRYLGFVTGMILAFIGAIFILGKIQEDFSKLGASVANSTFDITSSSPGIILVACGTVLMILTIVMQHTISVNDASIYLGQDYRADPEIESPQVSFPVDSNQNK